MIRLPLMPVSVVDELAEASRLTAEEVGAYWLLRMQLWQHGALPQDEERLALMTNVPAGRWPQVRAAIRPLFGEDWTHAATALARRNSEITRQNRSKAGSKGGRSRKAEKPASKPGESQPKSLASSPAIAGLKPGHTPRVSDAPNRSRHSIETGPSRPPRDPDHEPYPAVSDPDDALAWLRQRDFFPGYQDRLVQQLMAGELTPAILRDS